MSQRWTKREHDQFRKAWLLERMAHTWGEDGPTRCTRCGAKFGPQNSRRACPKRRKPNRWRLHYRRAMFQAQYPRDKRVVRTAAWIFGQLDEIRREVRRDSRFQDDLRYWKYHRLARRYRRLLREWWQLPAADVTPFLLKPGSADPDTFGGAITRRRNALLARAQKTQQRTIRDGDCVYTFYADATWKGRPLFSDGEAA